MTHSNKGHLWASLAITGCLVVASLAWFVDPYWALLFAVTLYVVVALTEPKH